MTASVYYSGAWNFATYGTATFTVTDGGGAHAAISYSSGYYDHGGLCVGAGVATPSISTFSTSLQSALTALSGSQVYTVTLNPLTGYTISVDTGTFSIALNAAAAKLLGVGYASSTINSTGTTWAGTSLPWFLLVPAKPGLTNYIPPFRQGDAIKERVPSSGPPYRLSPTSIPQLASWEHHFEPKARVDHTYNVLEYETITQLYSWEQMWTDYGLATLPIAMNVVYATTSVDETMAFSLLQPTYDQTVYQRMRPNDDARFKVMVKARLWPTSTANAYARSLNF